MEITMDSSGDSFTVTPLPSYNYIANPVLCKIIFSVTYNGPGDATLIDSTEATVGTGKFI